MSLIDHMIRQVTAVWKMAANAPTWRDELDTSVDGVFRSFQAAFFAFPLSLALYFISWRVADKFEGVPLSPLVDAGAAIFVGIQLTTYAIEWAASLALLVLLARAMRVPRQVASAIAGFNWAQVIISAVQLVTIGLISIVGTSPIGGAIAIPALVLQFAVLWGVIRRAFERDVSMSVAIIFMLLLLSMTATSLVTAAAAFLLQISS